MHQVMYAPTLSSLHIFCFLFGLAIFGGISILVLPFATLLGMGNIESAVSVGLVCFYVAIHILLPHSGWSAGNHGPKKAVINLKDLAIDAYVVGDKKNEDKPQCDQNCHSCSICLGDLCGGESAARGRVCGHIFHEECLTMWVNKSVTCPDCRQDLLIIDSTTEADMHKAGVWGIVGGVFDFIFSLTNSYWTL